MKHSNRTLPGSRARLLRVLGVALVAAAIAGCGSNLDDLRQYAKQVRARKGGHIEPLPQIQPYKTFAYDMDNERSPFVPDTEINPQAQAQNASGVHPDFNRNHEYLEGFPLDSLKMVGTLSMGGDTYAIISDPEGKVTRVKKGNYIGQNNGKITGISESGIQLREIVPNGLGGWTERQSTLALSGQ
ncbi:MAG: pilus assembly protein PilP [Gammaproteobacteria bacterium]|jgi:type IV pilus assembly protein PilP